MMLEKSPGRLKLWYRQKIESLDAVQQPRGRGRPHLAEADSAGSVGALRVVQDVLCAEGLIRPRSGMVGCRTQCLGDVTVWFGLSA